MFPFIGLCFHPWSMFPFMGLCFHLRVRFDAAAEPVGNAVIVGITFDPSVSSFTVDIFSSMCLPCVVVPSLCFALVLNQNSGSQKI